MVPCCRSYHHANLSIFMGREEGLTKVAGHRKLRLGYYALWTHSLQHRWVPQSTGDGFFTTPSRSFTSHLFDLRTLSSPYPSPLPSLPLSLCLPSLHLPPLILIIPLSLLPYSRKISRLCLKSKIHGIKFTISFKISLDLFKGEHFAMLKLHKCGQMTKIANFKPRVISHYTV